MSCMLGNCVHGDLAEWLAKQERRQRASSTQMGTQTPSSSPRRHSARGSLLWSWMALRWQLHARAAVVEAERILSLPCLKSFIIKLDMLRYAC